MAVLVSGVVELVIQTSAIATSCSPATGIFSLWTKVFLLLLLFRGVANFWLVDVRMWSTTDASKVSILHLELRALVLR